MVAIAALACLAAILAARALYFSTTELPPWLGTPIARLSQFEVRRFVASLAINLVLVGASIAAACLVALKRRMRRTPTEARWSPRPWIAALVASLCAINHPLFDADPHAALACFLTLPALVYFLFGRPTRARWAACAIAALTIAGFALRSPSKACGVGVVVWAVVFALAASVGKRALGARGAASSPSRSCRSPRSSAPPCSSMRRPPCTTSGRACSRKPATPIPSASYRRATSSTP